MKIPDALLERTGIIRPFLEYKALTDKHHEKKNDWMKSKEEKVTEYEWVESTNKQ